MGCGNNKIGSQIVQKNNNDNKQNSIGIIKNVSQNHISKWTEYQLFKNGLSIG